MSSFGFRATDLRRHGIIARIADSFRYRVTASAYASNYYYHSSSNPVLHCNIQ
jgi:hypothetical protein